MAFAKSFAQAVHNHLVSSDLFALDQKQMGVGKFHAEGRTTIRPAPLNFRKALARCLRVNSCCQIRMTVQPLARSSLF